MSDMTRDITTIISKGGKRGAYRRVTVDENGVITPSESTWHNLQYRMKSELEYDEQSEDIYGEAGELQAVETGNTQFGYMLTLSSFDKSLIDFLLDDAGAGKFFQLFVDFGAGSQSTKFEAFMPLVYIKKKFKGTFPGRKPDVEIRVLDNETAHTPSSLPSWANGVPANFVTPANRSIAVYES